MPLPIAPIACSRMPNRRLRPLPSRVEVAARDDRLGRAAEVGVAAEQPRDLRAQRGCRTLPHGDARRDRAPVNDGQRLYPSRPGSSPWIASSSCAASSGCASLYAAKRLAPRRVGRGAALDRPRRGGPRTSSGTKNFFSGSQPSAVLVAATSASPSGEPCAFDVPAFFGEPYPIVVLITMIDGRSCARPSRCAIAASSAAEVGVAVLDVLARASRARRTARRRPRS